MPLDTCATTLAAAIVVAWALSAQRSLAGEKSLLPKAAAQHKILRRGWRLSYIVRKFRGIVTSEKKCTCFLVQVIVILALLELLPSGYRPMNYQKFEMKMKGVIKLKLPKQSAQVGLFTYHSIYHIYCVLFLLTST